MSKGRTTELKEKEEEGRDINRINKQRVRCGVKERLKRTGRSA